MNYCEHKNIYIWVVHSDQGFLYVPAKLPRSSMTVCINENKVSYKPLANEMSLPIR